MGGVSDEHDRASFGLRPERGSPAHGRRRAL